MRSVTNIAGWSGDWGGYIANDHRTENFPHNQEIEERNSCVLIDHGEVISKLIAQLNPENAREVLAELKALPKTVDTYEARWQCLQVDPQIETWEALTFISTAELGALKEVNHEQFRDILSKPGVWLPEVDAIHANIMQNITISVARHLWSHVDGPSIQAFSPIALHPPAALRSKEIILARGSPTAGKTSFFRGHFAFSNDKIAAMICNRIGKDLRYTQARLQGSMLGSVLEQRMEEYFNQSFTRDGLFITATSIRKKIEGAKKHGQTISIYDLQTDFKTSCCRILKRQKKEEARMAFSVLLEMFKESIIERQECIDLILTNKDIVKEYQFRVWNQAQYQVIAELSKETGKMVITQPALFAQYATKVNELKLDEELEEVRNTLINKVFIDQFVALQPKEYRRSFRDALTLYAGQTIEQALNSHVSKADAFSADAGIFLRRV